MPDLQGGRVRAVRGRRILPDAEKESAEPQSLRAAEGQEKDRLRVVDPGWRFRDEPASPLTAPVLTGDFYVGFRSWAAREDGRLFSQNQHYEWPTGATKATCLPPSQLVSHVQREPHMVPAEGCGCGLYAYYRIRAESVRYGELLGVILVWGDIVLHRERMRAQFAKIGAILVPTDFQRPDKGDDGEQAWSMRTEWDRIDATVRRYGVPLLRHDTPKAAEETVASEFGRLVPRALLPSSNLTERRRLEGAE